MSNRSLTYIAVILSFAIGAMVSGCGERPKQDGEFRFKDEQAMHHTLRGNWILKEYADSIDAGWTPRFLESMLSEEHSLIYYPDTLPDGTTTGAPDHIRIGYKQNNIEGELTMKFEPKNNKVIFFESRENLSDSLSAKHVATAKFSVDGTDTILTYINDSVPKKRSVFVKYDMSSCLHQFTYAHLINSKFIAGKYYRADDTSRAHHILFTKCGSIEGVENISERLKGRTEYGISIGYFYEGKDAIEFYDPRYEMGMAAYWSVHQDTLLLDVNQDGKPIVLIRN